MRSGWLAVCLFGSAVFVLCFIVEWLLAFYVYYGPVVRQKVVIKKNVKVVLLEILTSIDNAQMRRLSWIFSFITTTSIKVLNT